METILLILNVCKLLSKKEIVTVFFIILFVFISSSLEIISLSLILPLLNFMFDNPISSEFYLLLNLVNFVSEYLNLNKKLTFSYLVIFILFCSFSIRVLYLYINESFAEKFSNKLVHEMYDKTFKASFEWTRYNSSTNVMQKIVQDCGSIGQATISSAIEFIYQIFLGSIGLISIIILSKTETNLIIILSIFFLGFFILMISPILKNLSKVQRHNQIKVVEKSSEFFRGMRFLKTNNLEDYASSVSKNIFSKANRARRHFTFITKAFPGLILFLGQSLVILLIINLVMQKGIRANDFVNLSVVGLILLRLMPAISSISASYNRLVKLIPYFESYNFLKKSIIQNSFFNEKLISNNRDFVNWKTFHISNISFTFEGRKIFENISLKFERNKIYGFVGKSGMGKTTLMDIISCLINSREGSLIVDGEILTNKTKQQWILETGYASQDLLIFDKSIEENIILDFNEKNSTAVNEIKKIVQLDTLEKNIAFNENLGEQGTKISGGQKQKIGIARSISNFPTFLILDEATSGMDRILESQIRKSLKNMSSQPTIIMISHNVETLKTCDLIIYFKQYNKIEVDKYKNLIEDKDFKLLLNI